MAMATSGLLVPLRPGGNVILRDGVQFAGGSGETLALVNGVIWTENSGNKWYEATATGWIPRTERSRDDVVNR